MQKMVSLEWACKNVLGITSRRYRDLGHQDIVPLPAKGKIDFYAASKALIEYYRKLSKGDGSLNLTDERAALAAIKRELAELDLKERKMDLIRFAEAERIYGDLFSNLQIRLLGQPRRLAPVFAPLLDEKEIEFIHRKDMIEMLKELSDGKRRIERNRSIKGVETAAKTAR